MEIQVDRSSIPWYHANITYWVCKWGGEMLLHRHRCSASFQGWGRGRRYLLVGTGLSQCFTNTVWKGYCSTPHREITNAPSLQEHQDHRPSLLTGCCCPVLTLGAPGAWMEPVGLLSLSTLLQRGSWSTCCHHYPCVDIGLSLLVLTSHWEKKGRRSTCR